MARRPRSRWFRSGVFQYGPYSTPIYPLKNFICTHDFPFFLREFDPTGKANKVKNKRLEAFASSRQKNGESLRSRPVGKAFPPPSLDVVFIIRIVRHLRDVVFEAVHKATSVDDNGIA